MLRFRLSLSIGAAAFSLFLAAAPAQALNTVSFVSIFTGEDTYLCNNPAAPCETISGALSKTEPGGEIKCVDNHVDGVFTIEKPITIDCAPGSLISGRNGSSGITINLDEATYPNGVVTLRNLNLSGAMNSPLPPGADGIRVIGGGAAVHVESCSIQDFAEQGIDFAPTSSVDLFVRDTNISNNANGGVFVHPAAAAVRGSVSSTNLDQNGGFGLAVAKASGAGVAITIEDTQVERNAAGLGPTAPARPSF